MTAGNGENLSDGSFAEYIAVKAHINIKLPDWVSFANGATLAVGITTVAQGMYQQLQLPLPEPSPPLSVQPGEPRGRTVHWGFHKVDVAAAGGQTGSDAPGGGGRLDGVLKGLDLLRRGEVSGVKLVYML